MYKFRSFIDIEKLDLTILCKNPNAIDILVLNKENLDWSNIGLNPNAIFLIENNIKKIITKYMCYYDGNIQFLFDSLNEMHEYNNDNPELILINYKIQYDWTNIILNPEAIRLINKHIIENKTFKILCPWSSMIEMYISTLCANPNGIPIIEDYLYNNFTQCNSVCINSDDTETCVVGTGESNAIAFIKGNSEIIYSDQTIIGSGNCILYNKNTDFGFWIVGGTTGTDTTKNSVLAVVIDISPKQYEGVQDSANSLSTCYTVLMDTATRIYIGGTPTTPGSSSVYFLNGNFQTITSSYNTILSTCYKLKKYTGKIYACGEGSDYNLTSFNGKMWNGKPVLDQNGNKIFTTIYDILITDDKSILVGKYVEEGVGVGVIAYSDSNILQDTSIWKVIPTIFTTSANSITYNSDQQIYEVVGEGTNTNAYSYDGIEWIPYTIHLLRPKKRNNGG